MAAKKPRQSRYKRDPERFSRIYLTSRDMAILTEILECRFLTTSQIWALFFGSVSACKLRMQKLWNKGYVKRVFAPVSFGSSEAIYCPTKKGINLLKEAGKFKGIHFSSKQNRVKAEKIQHELDINEVKIALILAVAEQEQLYQPPKHPNAKKAIDLPETREIFRWKRGACAWDYVRESDNGKKRISIRPDLVFSWNGAVHFLELDRATMSLTRFRKKLSRYKEYFKSGSFSEKYGTSAFLVLTTAPSEERRNNLVEQAVAVNGNSRCWFAVFDEVIENPFGEVWIRGREYNQLLDSLPASQRKRILNAHRKRERDELVEEEVICHSLSQAW